MINQGMVIDGVTKLSSWFEADNPPNGAVNCLLPFHPRGNGIKKFRSSSAHLCVSVAGYPRLDCQHKKKTEQRISYQVISKYTVCHMTFNPVVATALSTPCA